MSEKKIRIPIIIALILSMAVISCAPVFGQKSIDELEGNLKDAKQDVADAKDDYAEAKKKEKALENRIANLETAISRTEKDIKALQKKIESNTKKTEKVKARIAVLDDEVGSQQSDLNTRLRNMYMTGETNMLSVLLNSESIVDFISNLEMLKRIHKQDVLTLDELNAKLDEIEARRAELEAIGEELSRDETDLKSKNKKLTADKSDLEDALKEAHKETIAAWEAVEDVQAASDALAAELRNRKSALTYGGGKLGWPVVGRVSSEYGYRIHPISKVRKLHAGIDIAVPTGTPVHAAGDGEVIFAGWNSGGYGNLVLIDNGSGIVTAYAHNSSVSVSVGQAVKRGDVVAKAGSTGASTGSHVHFEVRVNGSPQNPRGWL